jgi:ribosomal protein L33
MKPDKRRALMLRFDQLLREHVVFKEIFGVL